MACSLLPAAAALRAVLRHRRCFSRGLRSHGPWNGHVHTEICDRWATPHATAQGSSVEPISRSRSATGAARACRARMARATTRARNASRSLSPSAECSLLAGCGDRQPQLVGTPCALCAGFEGVADAKFRLDARTSPSDQPLPKALATHYSTCPSYAVVALML